MKTFPLFVIAVLSVSGLAVGSSDFPQPTSPLQHLVFIVQENQTFDHFFGAFPNLTSGYQLPMNACMPASKLQRTNYDYPRCISPFNVDSYPSAAQGNNLNHGSTTAHKAYNQGKMNGFVKAQSDNPWANLTMGYVTNATIPDYWDYASYYALDANFFESVLSYSWPNHLFLVSNTAPSVCGTFNGRGCHPVLNLTIPNIVYALNSTGVDWAYFSQAWNDKSQCQPLTKVKQIPHDFWNVLPDWPAIQNSQSTCHRLQSTSDLFADLNKGTLPQVSWITPNTNDSDHAGCTVTLPDSSLCTTPISPLASGQLYVSNIVDRIESNATLASSTAIFITWDDFGGYYDHVLPNQVDTFGYGFRVPLIVISPYVKQGVFYGPTVGQQQDFTAFLSTIEHNWNLPPLSADGRDSTVGDLSYMFNFSQPARLPLILPTNVLATYPLSSCAHCLYGSSLVPYHAQIGLTLPQASGNCVPTDAEGDPCD